MADFIEGHCESNRDDFRSNLWPKKFYVCPQKGDFVESSTRMLWKVKYVTHTTKTDGTPYIRVYLDHLAS